VDQRVGRAEVDAYVSGEQPEQTGDAEHNARRSSARYLLP
jgi:hypothetical protein